LLGSALTDGKREGPAALSEGGWLAGGSEMACKVEDKRKRPSNDSTVGRKLVLFLPRSLPEEGFSQPALTARQTC